MIKNRFLLFVIFYIFTIISLFFYSFTQVDLNLTLSKSSKIQELEKAFIQIGYFNRPLSTTIFIILIILLFMAYFIILSLVYKKIIPRRHIWILIIVTTILLLFSYPAFSHDIFNYMFWARIFTHYGLSPYQFRALDFPADTWTRFMHWTHTTYNHGPLYLIISFIPSFLGLNKFVLTLMNFKLLNIGAYLGSIFFINKITKKIDNQHNLLAVSFFAFNPVVIIESLVSAHNDILMLFLALISIYFLISKKYIASFVFLILSAGIKFVTIIFVPLYIYFLLKKKEDFNMLLKLTIVFYLIGLIPLIYQREPYPWYFIPLIGFASLSFKDYFIRLIFIGLSCGLLLRYAPYLFFGDYKPPVPLITLWLTIAALVISILVWIISQLHTFKIFKEET
ncbi:MAG: hypothetical protein V1858_03860 [Candidatus Gottesmanbacteria bacterium]